MRVYLDNAATTPIAKEVVDSMCQVLNSNFGNPSSTHSYGRDAKALIETSRRNIAKHLNCNSSEIIFTSGGTEADNLACHIAVQELKVQRIITTEIEHHAVGHTVEMLHSNYEIEIVYLKVDNKGHINLLELESYLNSDILTLVSLMHANNEISTLLPINEVAVICKKHNAYFHSDTVQTMGHYPINLKELNIDFITGAAHKFHGPKGVGFLYINQRVKTNPMILGGAQERGVRGGTENVAGIVGLSKAMDLAYLNVQGHQNYVQELKSWMISELTENFDDILFHGDISPEKSLYTVLNVCFPKTDKASMLLFTLDLKGVSVSGGSACSSGANKGSHVLEGIGADISRPNVRFSFSRYTTKEELVYAMDQVKEVFAKILI